MFSPAARRLGRDVIPDFGFAVDDLHFASDVDLRGRALADQAVLALWLMRDVRDTVRLLSHLAGWAETLERLARSPGGEQAIGRLLRYVALNSRDLQLAKFRDRLRGNAPTVEAIAMTIEELYEAAVRADVAAKSAAAQAKLEAAVRAEFEAAVRAELETKSRVETAAAAVLAVLTARELPVGDDVRRRVEDCSDLDTLGRWLVNAATAASAEDVFQD